MRKGSWRAGLCAGVALASLLTACPSHKAAGPSDADLRGGTLVVGGGPLGGDDYDPAFNHNARVDFELSRCCLVRTLLSYNGRPTSEGGGELRPDLARSLPTVSADGLSWRFQLQPGLRYAPPLASTPIVAADFARAIERAVTFDRGNAGGAPMIAGFVAVYLQQVILGAAEYTSGRATSISGIETPDQNTIVFHLTHPAGDFGYRMAFSATGPLPAIPSNPAARLGVAEGHREDYGWFLVSTGPYMLEGADKLDFSQAPARQKRASGVTDSQVTLVRNPSWRRASDPLRPAYADRIVLTDPKTDSDDEAIRKIDSGELDMIWDFDLAGAILARARSSPDQQSRLHSIDRDTVRYVTLNIAVPPFDDLHLRRAVHQIVDKPALLAAYNGGQPPLGSPLESQPPVRIAGHVTLDAHTNGILAGYDPYQTERGPNGAGAREDMKASKYDSDHDGRCDAKACADIRAIFRRERPPWPGVARALSAQLAAIGVRLKLVGLGDDDFYQQFDETHHRTPMVIGDGWSQDFPNASTVLPPLFGSSTVGYGPGVTVVGATASELRRWGYRVRSVPSVDDRIRACLALAFAPQERCWAELDQYLMQNVAAIVPLFYDTAVRLVSPRVIAFSFDQDAAMPSLDRIAVKRTASPGPT